MKYLIDTNVILDVLLKREPFYNICAKVLQSSKQENIDLYVSASAITDIYYIANQSLRDKAEVKIWTPEELLSQWQSDRDI